MLPPFLVLSNDKVKRDFGNNMLYTTFFLQQQKNKKYTI